ncbi:Uncharacterized protein dnm_074390 [Desulfonema magnum]|uniref:Uncharacterized protein n=1 Tax=Desulfonema magnum TaxID=45655 RepID=A0A975BUA3_9BACT|nr:Uncharacterized protein dnm_074390 [Desulfonema magnum]
MCKRWDTPFFSDDNGFRGGPRHSGENRKTVTFSLDVQVF